MKTICVQNRQYIGGPLVGTDLAAEVAFANMSYRLLLVQPNEDEVLATRDTLQGEGYAVHVLRSFEDAVHSLADDVPDLLVTALRLGKYNGLHLVFRSRILYPTLPSLLTGSPGDRSSEIDRLGIRFLDSPSEREPLLDAVAELLGADRGMRTVAPRRWPRKPVHLPATISDSLVQVVELSYGGVRVEGPLAAAGVGSPISITFPTLGLSVSAVARWSLNPTEQGAEHCCGVEITNDETVTTARWRDIVDSTN